ncbi:MAG: hypothetical protein ABH954_04715 [Candidatus Omnitrophota bacterium]
MIIRLIRRRTQKRAQSTGEYAILIGLVIAAVVAMQVYIKRGLQGKVRDGMEAFGACVIIPGYTGVPSNQYEPYYIDSNYEVNRESTITDQLRQTVGNEGTYSRIYDDNRDRSGEQKFKYNGL